MIDVVVTTISHGHFLERWARKMGQRDDVRLVVIPDVSTPDLSGVVADITRRYGVTVECPDPDEQVAFLRKVGCSGSFIPWRSDNRRNVGFLLSWRDGVDVMVSVDDDNFPQDANWFNAHELVIGQIPRTRVISASGGWLNTMQMLACKPPGTFWPRGYPFSARQPAELTESSAMATVTINQGLWLGDPDIDAVTRLGAHPVAWSKPRQSCVLAKDTWTPVDSQNTAIHRDVIPAYWFTRMPAWGGRMGDIFSGYFAQACAKHLGHSVRVGTPLVTQERNKHDLLKDLSLEFPFYRLLEELLAWLPGIQLDGSTYRDAYESLSHALQEFAENLQDEREQGFLHQMAYRMRYWLRLCDEIGRQ